MTTLLLIRHGETDAVGKSIMGWQPGWRLNQKGREQVEKLNLRLANLPIRAIYTSPLERAIETAMPIASQHGISVQRLEDLGEMQFGQWEGVNLNQLEEREQWRRFNTFRSGVRPPGGELMVETQARMIRRLECVSGDIPGDPSL
jgi:broad specificity phosphatase PhoE